MASEPALPDPPALPQPLSEAAELQELRDSLSSLQRRMDGELRLAASVQRALLPQPRDFDGLELAREFLPFREIGGDYYDVFELTGHRLAIAIGDVMGKGVAAALLVATLKSLVRSELRGSPAPLHELVARVNRLFFEVTSRGRFASLFVGVVCLDSGRMDFVNAGHDYPLVVRAEPRCEELVAGGTVLGLVETGRYESADVTLARG